MTVVPDIRWISAHYGFTAECTHLAAPANGRPALENMVTDLLGASGLVAIYIPEGTAEVYHANDMRGRVIGAVRLLPMPAGGRMEDYFHDDWDGSRRWPIGWPCQAVFAPPVAECPALREHVETIFGPGSFRGYARQFLQGPFSLDSTMRERLKRDFIHFEPL